MSWRLAKSLDQFRTEVNHRWPNRDKSSDGTIGDERHRHLPSDHNPDSSGVVRAIDIDHDPRSGVDTYAIAEFLRQRKDPRISYVISNGRIFSSTVSPWTWRKYSGSNPHDHHMHLSVKKEGQDSMLSWGIVSANFEQTPPREHPKPVPPMLKFGSVGPDVEYLQTLLQGKGLTINVDGQFGLRTEAAVKKFQEHSGLLADGYVGPQTWKALT